jgi:GNAT superfamily N-acetyltransferase
MHFWKHHHDAHKGERKQIAGLPKARLLRLEDIDAFAVIRSEMLRDSPWAFAASPEDDIASHPEAIRQWFDEPEHEVVVVDHPEDRGRLASVVGIRRETKKKFQHRASVWGVYTTPDSRGHGYGRMVMEYAIGLARSWGGVDILQLGVSGNAPEAMGLYLSLGFVEWGVEPDCVRIHGVSYDEHYLALRL